MGQSSQRAPALLNIGRSWIVILVAILIIILIIGYEIFLYHPPELTPASQSVPDVSAVKPSNATSTADALVAKESTAVATKLVETSPTTLTHPTITSIPTSAGPQGKLVFACQISGKSDHNQICLVDADGSNWRQLTSDPAADNTYPEFSPDGQTIVFSLKKNGSQQIYEMDLSGKMHQLTNLPYAAYAPAISPDDRRIVFVVNDGRHQSLWLMNRDGSDPHQLTHGSEGEAWDPVWSPDGKQLLFASNRGGAIQLFVGNADGTDLHQLTKIDGLRGRSDWSSDGKTIATYVGKSWHREIILLNRDGSELVQITDGGNNLAPNFSPDSKWIAFTSYKDHYGDNNGCEIYTMRIDGSQIVRLTNNGYCDWQPNWGP